MKTCSRAAPGPPNPRAWRQAESHICSLSCTPEAPDCEVWDAKSHCWEAALLALHGHYQPRQCQAIAFLLEIAPARALSWEAEHWRGQTAVSYQRQLKKDISHTGFFFFPFSFFLVAFFFPRIKSTQQPPLQLPF